MSRARVERLWSEYQQTGRVAIGSSVVKGVSGMIGMMLLAALSAGMSYSTAQDEGWSAPRAWGCALVVLICLLGVFAMALPLVRRRRLVLEPSGFAVESRHRGAWRDEMRLPWDDVDVIDVHRSSNGESDSLDVRITIRPGRPGRPSAAFAHGSGNLPGGFRLSKRDTATLMETIRTDRS